MHTAYIGMGANIDSAAGSPEHTLAAAVQLLSNVARILRRSPLYSTAPVGYADQPRFVNAAVAVETDLAPRELLAALLQIEHEFGRDRASGVQNGPRTLDLDLLLYGPLVLHEADMDVPHPRIAERAFVLVPLNAIAPDVVEPRTGKTVQELLQKLRGGSPDDSQAVVPFESSVWRAELDGSVAGVRPDARDADG